MLILAGTKNDIVATKTMVVDLNVSDVRTVCISGIRTNPNKISACPIFGSKTAESRPKPV